MRVLPATVVTTLVPLEESWVELLWVPAKTSPCTVRVSDHPNKGVWT